MRRIARSFAAGSALGAMLALGAIPQAAAQGSVLTYPRAGQSPEQQRLDRFECHEFAVESTGFDPQVETRWLAQSQGQLATQPSFGGPSANQGGTARGAARGAALGAIGGAIGGNAGRGAAIGAGTGALFGTARRQSAQNERAQWEQQQATQRRQESHQLQAEFDQGMASYERAFTVCMRARDYEVL